MAELKDMTGQRFGKLVVLQRADDHIAPNGEKIVRWCCKCDCGSEVIARGKDLRYGTKTSCGCIRKNSKKKRLEKPHRKCTQDSVCIHNRKGVVCEDRDCSQCGWNPCNTKLKRQRLKNLNERMRGK